MLQTGTVANLEQFARALRLLGLIPSFYHPPSLLGCVGASRYQANWRASAKTT